VSREKEGGGFLKKEERGWVEPGCVWVRKKKL
jgi:hypothetical protein